MSPFRVRSCVSASEASEILYPWVVAEKWDPGMNGNDIKHAYYPSDPASFFVGTITQQTTTTSAAEKIVSSICAIKHDDNTGYIAFYVVDALYRGKGYGFQTFTHALSHLSASPWIGLDAVEAQMETYKKSGFVVQTKIVRYVGGGVSHPAHSTATDGVRTVGLDQATLEQLVDYDHGCTGMRRATFVSHWVSYHVKHGWGFVLLNQQQKIVGLGCMRRCASGTYRIAPLYADTLDHALDLVTRLTMAVGVNDNHTEAAAPHPHQFAVDAWTATPAPSELFADKLGWKPISTMYRMWRKNGTNANIDGPPLGSMDGFYAIASPEVG
ncbi:acyl-CoA N-acyltransferase [Zychaea mexicana]|uniref:acyl-CoA N-acyltransferase n=1 Tax=Zychaea mexicana TaxID=64656 RepID=UPI0022FE4F4A|nr:acyl-CoA N-acyltransferase [Zychaea mexicana]KAI9491778.1 acyl-CoA N-acyltransferase [Zychaea mexicana]